MKNTVYAVNRKSKRKKRARTAVLYIALILLSFYFLFPFFFVITRSLMTISEVNSPSLVWFPAKPVWENYAVIGNYFLYLKNTLIVVVINAVFLPISGAVIAFPFARYQFAGKKVMFSLLMSTVMMPRVVTSIPIANLNAKLGLLNKLASQWIGAFFGGGAMQIFLVIQYMRAVPKSLDEAAYIDGANKFVVFSKIVLPQCKNILVFYAVTTIIGRWNDYMGPLIYIWDSEKFTLAVAFYVEYSFTGTGAMLINEKMAMSVFMTLPSLILFAFFQKDMIEGVKIGGIKG